MLDEIIARMELEGEEVLPARGRDLEDLRENVHKGFDRYRETRQRMVTTDSEWMMKALATMVLPPLAQYAEARKEMGEPISEDEFDDLEDKRFLAFYRYLERSLRLLTCPSGGHGAAK